MAATGKRHPPEFFGKTGEDFDAFKLQFENFCAINGWKDEHRATHLSICLRGAALQTFQEINADERIDYDKLCAALARRFSPVRSADLAFAELRGRLQKSDESYPEFANAITSLASRAFPGTDPDTRNRMALVTFLDGLRDAEIRREVKRRKADDLNEAVQICLEIMAENKQDAMRQCRGDNNAVPVKVCSKFDDHSDDLNCRLLARIDETKEADYWRQTAQSREDGQNRVKRIGAAGKQEVSAPSVDNSHTKLLQELVEAVAALSATQAELKKELAEQRKRGLAAGSNARGTKRPPRTCFFCGKEGHMVMSCPDRVQQVHQDETPNVTTPLNGQARRYGAVPSGDEIMRSRNQKCSRSVEESGGPGQMGL